MKSVTNGLLKSGLQSITSAKMRNFWTMLGVIIGVASVITVVAIGQGVKQQVGSQLHHFGKNLITIRPAALKPGNGKGSPGLISDMGLTGRLTPKDITIIQNAKGVGASAPLSVVTGPVTAENGGYNDGFVIGTTSDLEGLLNQSVTYGSFLTVDDVGTNAAVLGPHAAATMFNEELPLGRTFTIRGKEFIVRGIFNDFSSTPLAQEADFNNAIFIPNDVAMDMTKNAAPIYEVLARARNTTQTPQVAASLDKALAGAHGGQSNLAVLQGNQNLAENNAILDLLTTLIAGVAAISLLVGGVGIMNVMLVSVAERMHEIGIRKAVGATNGQILSQFMIESTLLSLIGGLIGIAVSFVAVAGLRAATHLQPVITWPVVLVAAGVSLIVGMIFGSVPALKAARRDPIDALRAE